MMAILLVNLLLIMPSTLALFSMDNRILEHFHKWNTFSNCWGEENMLRYYQVELVKRDSFMRWCVNCDHWWLV
jgi:hypothetical protein